MISRYNKETQNSKHFIINACTLCFVMSVYALLGSNKKPLTEEQIEETLAGNLCRWTGYRLIIDAFGIFAKTDNLSCSNIAMKTFLKTMTLSVLQLANHVYMTKMKKGDGK